MFVIRFAFYFVISFAILCIPTGKDTYLFDNLLGLVSPYARTAMKTTKQKIATTTHYTKKLYSNSEPEQKMDQVKSKMAAIARDSKESIEDAKSAEYYSDDEEMRLRKILTEEE